MNIITEGRPIVDVDDPTPISLVSFFRQQSGLSTAFTESFLSVKNLQQIQQQLTVKLRQITGNPVLPVVEFTEAVLDALMTTAQSYHYSWVNLDTIEYANLTLVDNLMPSMEARYYEAATWRRWCDQGIPDPNNVPLPLAPEKTDFTAEIDSYTLSDPWGQPRPMW